MLEHTLVELLRRSAISNPDGVYARFNSKPFTYAMLDRDSDSLACAFMVQGLTKGDRVAVMMNNSLMALTVIFALSKAGLVWIPVNAQQRGEGLRYILDHSEPRLFIADADLVPLMVEALGINSLPIYSNGPADLAVPLSSLLAVSEGFECPPPGLEDPFAIMYTSGTTGRPKGAIVSHQMLLLASEAVSLVSGAQRDDVFFVWEALYHIGGAQLLPLPMTHGIRLAMVDRFSASRFWEQAKQEGATHIHHLGGILQLLLKQPPTRLDQEHGVKIAWGGGCPSDIWGAFQNRFGIMIRECYGMTEASSITTYNGTGLVGSVGKAIPWFSVQLLDEQDKPVQCGERGQIVVRENLDGALFPGYFRNPEVTAKALRGGALYTGDLGSFDADGNMFFHGRMSDSVRCKGENVSAWEVEHVAAEHPKIEDCAMIGVHSDIGEQDIKLFVKCKSGSSLVATELSVWLAQRLAPYQNPRYLAFVEDFERTASQRIMKHKLSPQLDDCWDRFAK